MIQQIIQRIRSWFDAAEDVGETSEVRPIGPISPVYSSALDLYLRIRKNRLNQIQDYKIMDEQCPEISHALNIYADNAVGGDGEGGCYEVEFTEGGNPAIEKAVKEIEDETDIKRKLWGFARALVQFGELFAEPIIATRVGNTGGLVRVKPLPVHTMWLNLDEYGDAKDEEKYFIQRDETEREIAAWPQHQMIHWRIEGDLDDPHGRSLLRPARPVFRRIHVVDNSLVIARARRANMRYVYKFDLPGMSPKDRQVHVDEIKKRHTTKKFIDRDTGQVRSEEAPMRVEDDIYISKNDDVTTLAGDTNITNIADVEHLYNQLFTAIGVPKSFLNREQDVNSKATLTELRIQFSRNVKRIQDALATGLRKFYQIGLLAKDFSDDQVAALKFEVKFPSVTATDELILWQTKQAKATTYESLHRIQMISSKKLEDVNLIRQEIDASFEEIEEADFEEFRDGTKPAESPGGSPFPFPPRSLRNNAQDPTPPKMPVEMESIIRRLSENPEEMDLFEDLKLLIDDNLEALQNRGRKPATLPRLPLARSSTGKGR